MSKEEHAPKIFVRDIHTVAVDIWSVGYIIKKSGLKWCALGKEQSDYLKLLMHEDPSERPTAAVALKKVNHFEQKYLNQCEQTSSRKPKARRKNE